MRYMLDTNICIYIIKQHPIQVFHELRKLSVGDVGISSITLAELHYGVEKSVHKEKNRQALQEMIMPLDVVHFDNGAAQHYGEIRAGLERLGKPIGVLDLTIAAHARSLGVILVTNNVKELNRVPKLKIINWV